MTGSAAPILDVGSGQVGETPDPPETCDLDQPEIITQIATKETIQDYVAALFLTAPHVNLTASYDDAGNLLAFTVDVDQAVADAVIPAVAAAHKRYEHDQAIASDEWTINHNFGVRPYAVHIVDTSGDDVIGDIIHINNNTVQINFSAAFAGRAYLGA